MEEALGPSIGKRTARDLRYTNIYIANARVMQLLGSDHYFERTILYFA